MGKVYKAIRFNSYDDMVAELKLRKEKCESLRKLAGNNLNTTIRFGSMFYLESSKTVVGIDKTGDLMSVYVHSWAELMHILEENEKNIYSIDDIVKFVMIRETGIRDAKTLAINSVKYFVKNSSNYNDCMIITEMIEFYHGMIECNEKQNFSDRPTIIRDESMDEMFYILRNGISGRTRALDSVIISHSVRDTKVPDVVQAPVSVLSVPPLPASIAASLPEVPAPVCSPVQRC